MDIYRPPWERQGLFDRNEGLKRWPLIYLFREGRLQAAGKRFMDWDGTPYIALRALPHRQEAGSSSGERAVIRWYGHEIIFARGQEQEVLVDGKRFKLKLKIKTFGGEPFIAVSEVGRLLGVRAVWMEAEDSVVLERDEQAGTEV